MVLPPNYGRRYTEAFVGIYSTLAAEFNLAGFYRIYSVALPPTQPPPTRWHPPHGCSATAHQGTDQAADPQLVNIQLDNLRLKRAMHYTSNALRARQSGINSARYA